jgi:hypothetical protein
MSREAIRKAIQNLNILFTQFAQKKYESKQKLIEFENLVIFNLKNFVVKSKELNENEKLSDIDVNILYTNYSEILKKVEATFNTINIKYRFPKLFSSITLEKIDKMTDVIGTVLKIMNATYDGEARNVGMLPTILSQIDLIETAVKPEEVPTAIKAIRTRLTRTAQAAVGENLTTFAQVRIFSPRSNFSRAQMH